MRWVFQRKAAGRAAAYRLARSRVRPSLMWRAPMRSALSSSKGASPASEAACSRVTRPISGMRTRIATAVRNPTPSTLTIRSSRSARSRCWRIAVARVLSSLFKSRVERAIFLLPELPDTWGTAGFAAGLATGDVLRDLLDQRQMLGKWRQAGVGRDMDLFGRCGAGCDQAGIDLVVLRPLQEKLGIGPHLRGLQHYDDKTIAAKMGDDLLLVATACLDADPIDPLLPQPGRQRHVAIRGVVDLHFLDAFRERHIELVLTSVDTGAGYAMLAHLPRPFLVMRTHSSFNHPGPMKSRPRSCYGLQPSRLRWATIRRSAVRPGRLPGPDHSSRNALRLIFRANTRVGKIACRDVSARVPPSAILPTRLRVCAWARRCIFPAVSDGIWDRACAHPTSCAHLCWVIVSTSASRPFFTSASARRSAGRMSCGLSIGPSP